MLSGSLDLPCGDARCRDVQARQGLISVRPLLRRAGLVEFDGRGRVLLGQSVLTKEREGAADVVVLLRFGEREQAAEPCQCVWSSMSVPGPFEFLDGGRGSPAVADTRGRPGLDRRDPDAGFSTRGQQGRLPCVVESCLPSRRPLGDQGGSAFYPGSQVVVIGLFGERPGRLQLCDGGVLVAQVLRRVSEQQGAGAGEQEEASGLA